MQAPIYNPIILESLFLSVFYSEYLAIAVAFLPKIEQDIFGVTCWRVLLTRGKQPPKKQAGKPSVRFFFFFLNLGIWVQSFPFLFVCPVWHAIYGVWLEDEGRTCPFSGMEVHR